MLETSGGRKVSRGETRGILPHRRMFYLLRDGVVTIRELGQETGATATLLVPRWKWWLMGHFPGNWVMPGVLQLECLAQTAGLWIAFNVEGADKQDWGMTGVDEVRWHNPIRPGQEVSLEARFVGARKGFYYFDAIAYVEGKKACEASRIALRQVFGRQ